MLIKPYVADEARLARLEKQAALPGEPGRRASEELRIRRAGQRGEKESAYLIDFDFGKSPNWAVLHDLQLEHGGRTAQIDHVLINRLLQVYVLETKHFHAGIKINDAGEFLRWNDWKKRYEGMPSPIEQNERHIKVLRDVMSTIEMPTRAGIRLEPSFTPYVLVAASATIQRPKKAFDASMVIKADQLAKTISRDFDSDGVLLALLRVATKVVSGDTVRDIAQRLAARHRALKLDDGMPAEVKSVATPASSAWPGAAESALPSTTPNNEKRPSAKSSTVEKVSPVSAQTTPALAGAACKHCSSQAGSVLYGKFGYYFKCGPCGTNTAIRFTCAPGHQPKLRKDGLRFLRECAQCGSSELYHTNPVGSGT